MTEAGLTGLADRWFVAEAYIRVNGVRRYVYRAVEQYAKALRVAAAFTELAQAI
jgi:transposase-like protein